MSAPNNLPENAPFGHEQKIALNALLPSLQPQQAAWLSGYFAHLAQMAGGAVAAAPARAAAPAAPTVPLTILFGSESGNAEGCAQQVDKAAKAAGFRSTVYDMGDYPMEKLASEKNVLIVVSTWGEGDPPERATAFHEFVHSDGAPKLEGVNFSVCALGDTSYPDFCECGIQFDKRFAELGANRIHDRVDCDLDFEEPFQKWLDAVMPRMVEVAGVKEAVAAAASGGGVALAEPPAGFDGGFAVPAFAPPVVEEAYSKKRPFPALVKEAFVLNDSASAKETLHVELDLAGSGLVYEPGDALGLVPTNCPEVVDDMLRLAGFRGDEIKEVEGDFFSLHELLRDEYDVTSLNRSVMAKYVPIAKNKRLENLLKEESKSELDTYLHGREIRDLFLDFPPAEPLTVDQLINLLRKIPPRLYSIASSLRAHPDEVHLCVAVVRYHTHGKDRKGVASTLLNDRLKVGDKAKVYVHTNKNFRLPEDPATPVIMIGPGTGVAPFRAFLEERSALSAPGKNWLFFGDQRFQFDFLYQTEWQDYLKSGTLTRMDVAFSRDTDKKVYVQHRMKEQAKDLYAWLEEGAYFYVCGDASRMAKDVHTALIEVIAEQGSRSTEEAEAYVKQLQKDRRYQRDVY